jgi:hypothetical protein
MGIWFDEAACDHFFVDHFDVSEIEQRRAIGWRLLVTEYEIPGWASRQPIDLHSNPVRREHSDDAGDSGLDDQDNA